MLYVKELKSDKLESVCINLFGPAYIGKKKTLLFNLFPSFFTFGITLFNNIIKNKNKKTLFNNNFLLFITQCMSKSHKE